MSAMARQIENLLARVRDLEAAAVRDRREEPESWIRAPRSQDVLIKTPVGGIPAATGSGPYTWGSAVCTIVNDDGTVSANTMTVKNIVNVPIAANVVGKASRSGSIWVIDVASCGA